MHSALKKIYITITYQGKQSQKHLSLIVFLTGNDYKQNREQNRLSLFIFLYYYFSVLFIIQHREKEREGETVINRYIPT